LFIVQICALFAAKRNRKKGFSLVEILIGLGAFSAIVMGVTSFMGNISNSTDKLSINDARNMTAREIENAIKDPENLIYSGGPMASSSPGNLQLEKCLNPGNALDCTVTNFNNQASFNFYSASFQRKLGGTNATPVSMNRNGVRDCDISKPGCPFFNIKAYFWAACPNKAASCKIADAIYVRYQISPVVAEYKGLPLKATPPNPKFATDKSSFAHRIDLKSTSGGFGNADECLPGSTVQGTKKDGTIVCKCRFGFKPTGVAANGHPICTTSDQKCPKNEELKGFTSFGIPICVDTKIICKKITFRTDDAGCPNGGWLEAIDLGQCKAGKASKKSSSRGIKCAKNQGKCCWRQQK